MLPTQCLRLGPSFPRASVCVCVGVWSMLIQHGFQLPGRSSKVPLPSPSLFLSLPDPLSVAVLCRRRLTGADGLQPRRDGACLRSWQLAELAHCNGQRLDSTRLSRGFTRGGRLDGDEKTGARERGATAWEALRGTNMAEGG
ncbi:hypothetical protein LZ31DRAFT_32667 [Colletotrichum somersetense]|nr:hypothetical protein LZ31DRAFT_32667 [Colletotrichum somersetense]